MPESKDAQSQQPSIPRSEVEDSSQREFLWKQYALHCDIYKFHFEIVIKVVLAMFAVTGALLGYYIKLRSDDTDLSRFLLVPACAMNLIVGFAFLVGARGVPARNREVVSIAKRFGFQSPPNLGLLQLVLFLCCGVTCVTAATLVYLIFK